MDNKLVPFLHLIFAIIALVSTGAFVVRTYLMLREIRPNKQLISNLIPLMVLVMPEILTEQGQRHRTKAFVNFIVAIVSTSLGFLI